MVIDPTLPHPRGTLPFTGSYFFVCLSSSRKGIRYADIIFATSEAEALRWMFYNFLSGKLIEKASHLLSQLELMEIEDAAWSMTKVFSRYSYEATATPWDVTAGPLLSFEPKSSP